jgi:hypothetical protein
MRVVIDGRVDPISLEMMGLDFLFDMHEYLDVQSYLEKDVRKVAERKSKKKERGK